ncbi:MULTISPECIES: (E)-4-hydroxy-3-methylbut-2-enyl-diphosphate synthase [Sanguibacteroides]|uniref:4-hydroxy-3-methylbut-2-en-1-yl diphosphate synthase (flavodoxin) n=1 Tax=Sanguibacteroides justesenii TaxID=1547597 RepID=A0A0C3MLK6_9PORP|nr:MULTISPECIES: (E)-4-hydroxy-3-methylbut-2-enyl-diphosphate synthase [Sanguibacteroides]KIO47613.1 4-hydroxy-3-methylbut-2-en-1-yl diphosphate synthase [Sanguibacteroides justesenii]PXZ44824.1 4-hydroxy-3-methylbut-2-en-1-yl diphosphate synthase [Sanguibacteroides justesenii]
MRRRTRQVKIGNTFIGSEYPVLVQSMLNTSTMDTFACVEQAVRIIEAGGELVRITAPGRREAENLKNIHIALREKGYREPLSADIHFNPVAAMIAARYVEKVRINPGNFVDKRATFEHLEYTEEEYTEELERLRAKFTLFLNVCREYHTAVRIGTNHGSLSDRIMSRYGDTPEGMVEATMEYLRVCRDEEFNDVVISLKSSDCRVMVEAVRLLVREMEKEGMDYPLHLGVTEAGEGEDGRIRSAVGIGTLLNEGIGDTIRVSLTEAPQKEIPIAQRLVRICTPEYRSEFPVWKSHFVKPLIVADISHVDCIDERITAGLDFHVAAVNDPVYGDLLKAGKQAPEIIYTEALGPELTKLPESVKILVPYENIDVAHVYNRNAVALIGVREFLTLEEEPEGNGVFVEIRGVEEINQELAVKLQREEEAILVLTPTEVLYSNYRHLLERLAELNIKNRVIIRAVVSGEEIDDLNLRVAAHVGGLFIDRQGYGLWISYPQAGNPFDALSISRNILQSAGVRRYKTEFISCPGCGRTLYNLEESVAKVKKAFAHLSKLKIAVMGCIVNGPGEMGDADYGYVGAGNGKVNLYRGKEVVRIAVPESEALEALKQVIIDNGDWE